jgi:hypothetical protein
MHLRVETNYNVVRRRFFLPAGYLMVELADHFLQKDPKKIQQDAVSYFDPS